MTMPAPLTPANCDLKDFKFMPLDVARLRDSDMAAYESPEACWAAVLLWAAAWHQVPAASLPDDDRFLAKAAGYGRVVKEWANVRDGALHGWIKCADGRLYHPVVAEKANESWHKKLHHAWKKECDRLRKANKQRESEGKEPLPFPPEPTVGSAAVPVESVEIPAETPQPADGIEDDDAGNLPENALKGQGEGQGEGQGQGEFKNNPAPPLVSPPQPELGEPILPTEPGQLSIAMRRFGINANPGDPRLIALAQQGVTTETMQAACEEAKRVKRDAAIPPNFVFSILERWAKEASSLHAAGAAQPGATTTLTRAGQATARNMESWLERKRQEQNHG